mmetsp:Transcript_109191/g.170749  ORF Transcript_109191/g.170749 Transcript_109191/m.170749 type:complete len:105 (+) Transcript_109191:403-717(+)
MGANVQPVLTHIRTETRGEPVKMGGKMLTKRGRETERGAESMSRKAAALRETPTLREAAISTMTDVRITEIETEVMVGDEAMTVVDEAMRLEEPGVARLAKSRI